ncbi:MAG: hypothetical protein IPK85_01245 [Gemmatimonadetes bacterium]|nr:hypothetical protein [Gemmatimonadota bacterium]
MAKKSKSKKSRKSLKGMMKMQSPVAAVLISGGATAATVLGIRQFVTPTDELTRNVTKHAPLVGIAVGMVPALMAAKGNKALAMAGGVASLLVGGTIFATQHQPPSMVAAADSVAGLRGMGAIVPQLSGRRNGMGAIMMEQLRGNDQGQGAVIDLAGARRKAGLAALTGTVSTSAFGTSTY